MNGRRYGMPERAALRPLYPTDPSWIEAQQSGLIASPCLLSNGVHTGFSRHTINDHLGKSITLQSTKRSSATRWTGQQASELKQALCAGGARQNDLSVGAGW